MIRNIDCWYLQSHNIRSDYVGFIFLLLYDHLSWYETCLKQPFDSNPTECSEQMHKTAF